MHCFTETLEVARSAVDLGFLISFSGIVTFKNAADLRATVKALPLERILVETDAPYLAPVPHRGKTNHPAFVRFVADEIARLREQDSEAVAAATTRNFAGLFRPPEFK
jgi:TatD DNase family protein